MEKNSIADGLEQAKRTANGDPTTETTWKDTLILLGVVFLIAIGYIFLK